MGLLIFLENSHRFCVQLPASASHEPRWIISIKSFCVIIKYVFLFNTNKLTLTKISFECLCLNVIEPVVLLSKTHRLTGAHFWKVYKYFEFVSPQSVDPHPTAPDHQGHVCLPGNKQHTHFTLPGQMNTVFFCFTSLVSEHRSSVVWTWDNKHSLLQHPPTFVPPL